MTRIINSAVKHTAQAYLCAEAENGTPSGACGSACGAGCHRGLRILNQTYKTSSQLGCNSPIKRWLQPNLRLGVSYT